MSYRMTYLRINSRGYSSGWASDAERDAFKSESRRLFQDMGWSLHEGRNGSSDTVTQHLLIPRFWGIASIKEEPRRMDQLYSL